MIAGIATLPRRLLAFPVLLAVAVIAQVVLVNRLPLPGGAAPDLVALLVAALAVVAGPVPGTLAGFTGGLALDVAPPGSDLAGEHALVLCLVGYVCGAVTLRRRQGVPQGAPPPGPLLALPVMAVGVAAAEALRAALGMLVSDPRVTSAAVSHVLPTAIIYDLLLSPFVLWLVAAVKGAPEPGSATAGPVVLAAPKVAPVGHAVVRGAGAAALVLPAGRADGVPSLRFSNGRVAQVRTPVRAGPGRTEPKLRLAGSPSALSRTSPALGTTSPALSRLRGGAFSAGGGGTAFRNGAHGGAAFQDAGARGGARDSGVFGGGAFGGKGAARIDFSGALGPSLFTGSGPRTAGLGSLRPASRRLGRNWMRNGGTGPTFRRAMLSREGEGGRTGPVRSVNGSPPRGWLRVARPTAPSRVAAVPGRGWLRASAPVTKRQAAAPGKGWLRPAKPATPVRRATPGRGWLSRKPARLTLQSRTQGGRMRRGWRRRHGLGRTRIGGRR